MAVYPPGSSFDWAGPLKAYIDDGDAQAAASAVVSVGAAIADDNPAVVDPIVDLIEAHGGGSGSADAPIPYLVGVPMYIYGDSYSQIHPPEATPGPRIARKHEMIPPVNYGVSGSTFAQMYNRIVSTWVPNTRGLVLLADGTINAMQVYTNNAAGWAASREAFRACLAYLSARYVSGISEGGGTQYGPGWTKSAIGMSGTTGAYVDIAWDSGPCDVLVRLIGGQSGTIEFRNASGAVVSSGSVSGLAAGVEVTGALTIPSQGAGVHTVRGFVTSGTVVIERIAVRASTPPTFVWDKAGIVPFGGTPLGTTALRAFQAEEIKAANAFGVIVSDNDVPGWNPATMIVSDAAHRNDRGQAFATATMDAALRAGVTDFRQGMNSVDVYTADAPYVVPSPSYISTSASLPSAPVLTAITSRQVSLSWTRPSDGGSTITGYQIERSPAGAGTWTSVATITGGTTGSHSIISGLTPATTYDFRVRAVNSVGSGSWSIVKSAAAGPEPTFYSRDTFTRADDPLSMGTAEVGGAWGYGNSAFGLSGGVAVCAGNKTVPENYNFATVSDGEKTGYVEVTLTKLDTVAGGVVMNANAAGSTQSAVLYSYAGKYLMAVQIAANNYVQVGSYSITPKDGDRIGIFHSGLTLTAVINGAVQPTYTGSVELAGVRHGVFCFRDGQWDSYTHSNVDPR